MPDNQEVTSVKIGEFSLLKNERVFYLIQGLSDSEVESLIRFLKRHNEPFRGHTTKMVRAIREFFPEKVTSKKLEEMRKKVESGSILRALEKTLREEEEKWERNFFGLKEKLFKICYPKLKKFDNTKLSRKLSELTETVEDFLILQTVENDKLLRNKILKQAMVERNQVDAQAYYMGQVDEILNKPEDYPNRNFEFYQERRDLYFDFLLAPLISKSFAFKNGGDGAYAVTQQVIKDSYKQYLLFSFFSALDSLHWRTMRQKTFENLDIDWLKVQMRQVLEKEDFPLGALYLELYEILEKTDKNDFDNYIKLQERFIELSPMMKREQKVAMQGFFNNYLFTLISKGGADDKVYQNIYDFFQKCKDKGFFTPNCLLSSRLKATHGSLAAHDVELAQRFFEANLPFVAESEQEETIIVVNAMQCFREKKYAECLAWAALFNKDKVESQYYVKNIKLMATYETRKDAVGEVRTEANNYKKHLALFEKEWGKGYYAQSTNLCEAVLILCQKKPDLTKLKELIEEKNPMAARSWVQEKLTELERSQSA